MRNITSEYLPQSQLDCEPSDRPTDRPTPSSDELDPCPLSDFRFFQRISRVYMYSNLGKRKFCRTAIHLGRGLAQGLLKISVLSQHPAVLTSVRNFTLFIMLGSLDRDSALTLKLPIVLSFVPCGRFYHRLVSAEKLSVR